MLYADIFGGAGFPHPCSTPWCGPVARGRRYERASLRLPRQGELLAPDAPMDFNSALNTVLLFQSRVRIVLVSNDADEQQATDSVSGTPAPSTRRLRWFHEVCPKPRLISSLPGAGPTAGR